MTDTLGLRRKRCLVCHAGNHCHPGTRTGEGHTARRDTPTCPSEDKGSEIRELPAPWKAFVDGVQKPKQQVLGCWFTSDPSPSAVISVWETATRLCVLMGETGSCGLGLWTAPPIPGKEDSESSRHHWPFLFKFLAIVTALWILILRCPVVRSLARVSHTLQTQLFIMSV